MGTVAFAQRFANSQNRQLADRGDRNQFELQVTERYLQVAERNKSRGLTAKISRATSLYTRLPNTLTAIEARFLKLNERGVPDATIAVRYPGFSVRKIGAMVRAASKKRDAYRASRRADAKRSGPQPAVDERAHALLRDLVMKNPNWQLKDFAQALEKAQAGDDFPPWTIVRC